MRQRTNYVGQSRGVKSVLKQKLWGGVFFPPSSCPWLDLGTDFVPELKVEPQQGQKARLLAYPRPSQPRDSLSAAPL